MKNANNLQDVFLNNARKLKVGVTAHLINGFRLKGYVKGFDNFTVIIDNDGKQMMIYKHAIATISPNEPLLFNENPHSNIKTYSNDHFFI